MSQSAAPQLGDTYLLFDGQKSYVEIPSANYNTVKPTGALTVATWMRPDTLDFPRVERDGYVHWLGKGDKVQGTEEQEWTFRMYNHDVTNGRSNRISFYVFNSEGGLGVGAHYQHSLVAGQWLHVAGVIDHGTIHIYINGEESKKECFQYQPPVPNSPCHVQTYPATGQPVVIHPRPGQAPLRLGTRDCHSYFQGGLSRVRIWQRVIGAAHIRALFASDTLPAPPDAEYLFDADTGAVAVDSAQGNNGTIHSALFVIQR
jgi:Concanavalin A-like lectin/glucanases superfamily